MSDPRTPEQQEIVQFLDDLLIDVASTNRILNERGYLRWVIYQTEKRTATEEELQEIMETCFPWIQGPKSILHALVMLTQRCERGGLPTAGEIHNMLFIIHHLEMPQFIKFSYETRRDVGRRTTPDWSLPYLMQHLPITESEGS